MRLRTGMSILLLAACGSFGSTDDASSGVDGGIEAAANDASVDNGATANDEISVQVAADGMPIGAYTKDTWVAVDTTVVSTKTMTSNDTCTELSVRVGTNIEGPTGYGCHHLVRRRGDRLELILHDLTS